jgi:hypothetical protein
VTRLVSKSQKARLTDGLQALTIGDLHNFFVLLISHPFTDCGLKRRETKKSGQVKMAWRGTETTYLEEVLEWLTQYWTDEAFTSEVRIRDALPEPNQDH